MTRLGKQSVVRYTLFPLLLLVGSSVHAQTTDWSAGLHPELELTSHLNDRLDIRFGVNTERAWPERRDAFALASGDDTPVFSALVDWSVADGGLRMTGGAIYGNELFSSDDLLPAPQFSAEDMRTYVGVGYDNDFGTNGRFGLSLDMGLTFDSVPATGDALPGSAGADTGGDLGNRFESLRYTPSFSAGVEYRF